MTWKSVSVRSSTRSTSLTKYPSIRASIDAGAADVRSSPRPTNRSRQRNIPGTRRPKGQSDGDWLSRRSTNHTRAEWEIVVPQGMMGPSSRTHHALAPTIDLSPWQLAACVANRPKPPRIRQSLHRCRVMLRVNVLVEPIVFHPGVFARFLERHRAIGAAYRADLPSQTSPAISAILRILDFAKGRIDFAELAADALDR
jgi:hypothetical protein